MKNSYRELSNGDISIMLYGGVETVISSSDLPKAQSMKLNGKFIYLGAFKDIELDKTESIKALRKVAEALGIDVDYLFKKD